MQRRARETEFDGCENCRHAKPHKPLPFLVCAHPRMLDYQKRLNGSQTGIHVELASAERLCGGKLFERE